jgi:MFS family permease
MTFVIHRQAPFVASCRGLSTFRCGPVLSSYSGYCAGHAERPAWQCVCSVLTNVYNVDWAAIRTGARVRADASEPVAPARLRWLPRVSPVVWSLGFTSLLTDISSEMVSSILPIYLVLHLHVSPAVFGVIDGLYQGIALLVRTLAGFLGDRWQRHKTVAVIGYGLSAVCRPAMLAVGSAWGGIAALVALDRTAKGIRTAPRDALISQATPPTELARAFGVHRALDAAGAMLGPLLAFGILAAIPLGFDVIFVASFCFALLGVAVIALFVRSPEPRPRGDRALSPRAAMSLLRDRRLGRIALAAGLLSLATVSDAFIFLALQRQIGFDGGMIPLLFVAIGLVNCALSIPGGYLADRFGRPRLLIAGHALLLCAYATLAMPAGGAVQVVLCLVLVGAYYAATDGVLAAITAGALPREVCGTALSVVSSITNLGRLISSMLFGFAWAAWGLDAAVTSFMIGLAIALAAGMIVLGRPSAVNSVDAA